MRVATLLSPILVLELRNWENALTEYVESCNFCQDCKHPQKSTNIIVCKNEHTFVLADISPITDFHFLVVTSRQVVWLLLKQLWLEFVPVLHGLQGRFAAQG